MNKTIQGLKKIQFARIELDTHAHIISSYFKSEFAVIPKDRRPHIHKTILCRWNKLMYQIINDNPDYITNVVYSMPTEKCHVEHYRFRMFSSDYRIILI